MTDCTVAAPVRAIKASARAKTATAAPAPAISETAPPAEGGSLIVLTLRPDGARFNGNRIERAQEAGFRWLQHTSKVVGYVSPDTGEEIARFVVNNSDEALGQLKEIQLHINPKTCAYQWHAGTTLLDMLRRYAVLIGAHVADGTGRALAEDELQALAEHIDTVMVQREKADRAARTVETPDGECRLLSELSFMHDVLREAGERKKTLRRVYFDAAPADYFLGRARGMEMAGEVASFFQRHKSVPLPLKEVLKEAIERSGGGLGDYEKATVANVSDGFLEIIVTMVTIGARHFNLAWLAQRIEREKAEHEDWQQYREKRRAQLVDKLRRGREAAKARRLAAAKESSA